MDPPRWPNLIQSIKYVHDTIQDYVHMYLVQYIVLYIQILLHAMTN